MTQDVASPLEERLRAALTDVAEHVSVDALPAMWPDEEVRRTSSQRVRILAVAALAASLAVGVAIAVNGGRSKSVSEPIPSSTSITSTPAALACPSHLPSVGHHQIAGTDASIVPGEPTELLTCRYHGLNQPESAGSFAKSARFDPGRIANDLNAQPPIPPGLRSSCPADFSETIVLLFGYADDDRLAVSIGTTGCRYATNGDRRIRMDPVELARLQTVLGRDDGT